MDTKDKIDSSRIVTIADIEKFKIELLRDIKKLLNIPPGIYPKPWLKSHEVRRMLKISAGTLQHLRDSGKLKYSRVGGIIFYAVRDIEEMLDRKI